MTVIVSIDLGIAPTRKGFFEITCGERTIPTLDRA